MKRKLLCIMSILLCGILLLAGCGSTLKQINNVDLDESMLQNWY